MLILIYLVCTAAVYMEFLLRARIRLLYTGYLGTARFMKLLYVSFLGIKELVAVNDKIVLLLDLDIPSEWVHLIDFLFTHST